MKPRTKDPKIEMPRDATSHGGGENGPDGNRRKAFIRRLDRDGDGKVSPEEFDGPRRHFSDFDRNRDGYITEDETPTGPPPTGRGAAR